MLLCVVSSVLECSLGNKTAIFFSRVDRERERELAVRVSVLAQKRRFILII